MSEDFYDEVEGKWASEEFPDSKGKGDFLDYLTKAVDTGAKVYSATQSPKKPAAKAGARPKNDLTTPLLIGGGALVLLLFLMVALGRR